MPAKKPDVVANFFSKIDREPHSDCWLWKGALRANGYGVLYINRLPVYAHRWSYEYHKGPIPEGLVIDHLCHVRYCVNPEHMEIVTQKVNILRGPSFSTLNGQKTHCPKGHLYDEKNTYYYPNSGGRRCRECSRIRNRQNAVHKLNFNAQKTHCLNGHPFDEANTRYVNGKRRCKTCDLRRQMENRKLPHKVRTHCSQGHPYDEYNTFFNSRGYRRCKTCTRERRRGYYTRKNTPPKDDHHTKSQWEALKAKYNYTCLKCGKKEPEIKLTADRVIPGCKGGAYNIDNIQPLCGSCNSKKHTKVIDFRPKTP